MTMFHMGQFDQPLLIFGGPYGNLQATRAMRQTAQQLGIPPSHIICNGDCVAYCAQPEETVELIRTWGVRVIMGNCEQSLAEGRGDCGCGFETGSNCSLLAEDWYPYCAKQLSDEAKAWMGGLPRAIGFDIKDRKFHLIHGGLSAINRFIYASTPVRLKLAEMAMSNADVVIGGHAGLPFGERLGDRYWLNSGVIGMPANDGTADGWYLKLIPGREGVRCEWCRLVYDAGKAQDAMRNVGRFNGYAETLRSGLWPSMDVLPEHERSQRGRALEIQPMMISTG